MKKIINKIKVFLNRYNPREVTRLLKCIEKEIYNINKVIGIIRNREVKERNEVLTNRIDNHYDELNDKYDDLENTIDNVEYDLDSKIKALKGEHKSLKDYHNNLASDYNSYKLKNKSAIDIKIDDVANELLLSEFSRYLTDNVDVFDYDYKSIQQDLLLALIDSKDYTISIKRRVK